MLCQVYFTFRLANLTNEDKLPIFLQNPMAGPCSDLSAYSREDSGGTPVILEDMITIFPM